MVLVKVMINDIGDMLIKKGKKVIYHMAKIKDYRTFVVAFLGSKPGFKRCLIKKEAISLEEFKKRRLTS